MSWDEVFSNVEACIEKQDFERAQEMLDAAKTKARADFIDPRWVMKEISAQEKRIPRSDNLYPWQKKAVDFLKSQ